MPLYPYQQKSLDTLATALQKYPAVLDASQTGTGKTYVALALAKKLGLRPAIVCPKTIITPWKRVAHSFDIVPHLVLNYEALKTLSYPCLTSAFNERRNKDVLKWNLPADTLLIFDEFHRCKGVDTINARIAIAALASRVKILLLSATIATSPIEMNALGVLLNMHQGWNFYDWCRMNGCTNDRWGGLRFNNNYEKIENIHNQIFPERGTRIRIQDLGDQFPETKIAAETYEVDEEKLKEIYGKMQAELAGLQQRIDAGEHEETPLVIMLRARQQAELLKVPVLHELCEDGIAEGNSVAIFVNFNDTLRALARKLARYKPCFVHGEQTDDDRIQAIDSFQSDRNRVIICNLAAGGVGISLHDTQGTFPRLSLISPSYSATDVVQALGRVHRAGGKTKSIQRIVFAAGCIEEQACQAVQSKIHNLNLLNDGDLTSGIKFI